jgi:hypothetical protein
MSSDSNSIRSEVSLAQQIWSWVERPKFAELRQLVKLYRVSIALGDVRYIDGHWYVTNAGLLRLAHRVGCTGIRSILQTRLSDAAANRWVFKATVYRTSKSRGFVGYGDADPSNVSPLVRGAEMRIAETRAVNRALRKAYGIGLCSVEELASFSTPNEPVVVSPGSNGHAGSNSSSNGQPRMRDQLCLLIRQHNLDPNLVKAYAADFCGTQTLREASRDLLESFIAQLAAFAKKDRDGLICKLNSYARPAEATP